MLRLFLERPKRLISREAMLEALGGAAVESFDRAMDVRISRLRTKLREDPKNPRLIKTIYGAAISFWGMSNGADGGRLIGPLRVRLARGCRCCTPPGHSPPWRSVPGGAPASEIIYPAIFNLIHPGDKLTANPPIYRA